MMKMSRRWTMRRGAASSECQSVAEVLQQYLDNEATPEAAARVARHLDECKDCGFEAGVLSDLKDAVRRHGESDGEARSRLQAFAEQLARGDVETADEPSN